MRQFWRYAAVTAAALAIGCGGGGGDGASTTPPPLTPVLDARLYNGHYVSECDPLPDSSNYETGDPLYARLVLTVSLNSASAVADLSGRFDFYDDNACTDTALGAVTYTTGTSHLYLVAEKAVTGGTGHKVVLELMPVGSTSYSAGPTADTVLLGSALRLKIPKILATGFYIADLWRLQGNDLYDGDGSSYDSQGFPANLSSTVWASKASSLPAAPDAPCAGSHWLYWTAHATCATYTVPKASGRTLVLTHTGGGGTGGTATASCSNGTWSVLPGAICNATYVPVTCPAQTLTWTSGANTCSGTVPLTVAGLTLHVANTTSGLVGAQFTSCQSSGNWTPVVPGSCDTPPPPTPPITDPVQLAQVKNCIACHAVTGTGYSANLPSFERIADRYRGSPPAAGVLETRVKSGSNTGAYGTLPMPANPQISDAELAIVIPWILAQ